MGVKLFALVSFIGVNAILLLCIVYAMDFIERNKLGTSTRPIKHAFSNQASTPTFRQYNYQGVFTIKDICIEKKANSSENVIVIYNTPGEEGYDTLIDSKSIHSKVEGWPVLYKNGGIPSHMDITDVPAYFMHITCDGNLHHFMEDSLRGLYHIKSVTGQIQNGSPSPSHVFVDRCPKPLNSAWSIPCLNHTRYKDFALHLGAIPETYSCLHEIHSGLCFRHAGFGYKKSERREFYSYLLRSYRLSHKMCRQSLILFLDRKYRRIRNIEELAERTRQLQLNNTRVEVVMLDNMTVVEQLRKVYCARIYVGVQGAGLQWLHFMPQNASGLLEVGWKNWPTSYDQMAKQMGLAHRFYRSANLTFNNWQMYERINRLKPLSDAEKVALLEQPREYDGNPYKFADTDVDVNELLTEIKYMMRKLEILYDVAF